MAETAPKSTNGTAIRKKKHVVPPVNPVLDTALTVSYVAACLWVAAAFLLSRSFTPLYQFAGFVALTAIGIRATKVGFALFGKCLGSTILKHTKPLESKHLMRKWCDQSWQLVIHVSMAIWEWSILRKETWYYDTETTWMPCPDVQVHSQSLELFYLCQLAIWIYTAFSHRFIEARRKDYVVMFVHHIATIILVGGSYFGGNLRIGVLVLLAHDVSDVTIDLLKMFNYIKLDGARHLFLLEITFAVNLINWVYWRNYVFPFHFVRSAFFEAHGLCSDPKDKGNYLTHPAKVPGWAIANFFLLVLTGLHIYWTHLWIRLTKFVVSGNTRQGGKEEYEGSDSDESEEEEDNKQE